MTLKEWLLSKDIKQGEFAEFMGVNRVTVCQWCNGHRPTRSMAKSIERITKGQVLAEDLLKQSPWKKDA